MLRSSLNDSFSDIEGLYRAIYPPQIADIYWKANGQLSSAAFKDRRGLSVERGAERSDEQVKQHMSLYFTGLIYRVFVKDCNDINAVVKYLPSRNNVYHSEIHGSENQVVLSQSQAKHLAQKAVCV